MENVLAGLDTVLLYVFGACALAGAVLMIVLQQPMRVALALIATMVSLGVIYGLLGVHFIAAFQILIYVGAVMVFMVYVIMLLDPRDPGYSRRYSRLLFPGIAAALLFLGAVSHALWHGLPAIAARSGAAGYGMKDFAVAFLDEYWLHFELTSVLLVAAVVAALAVVRVSRKDHRG